MKSFFDFLLPGPDKRHLTVFTGLRARPGQQDNLMKLLRDMVTKTRRDPGCLCYILHQSEKDAELFTIYQTWVGEDYLLAHTRTPHVLSFGATVPDMLEGRILHTYWRIVN